MKLTLKQIDQLQAGKELDALIAEHVMGWRKSEHPLDNDVWIEDQPDYSIHTRSLPAFSTEMDFAWEVAEIIQSEGYALTIYALSPESFYSWMVSIQGEGREYSNNVAETICKVALKAKLMGVKQ